MTGGGPSMRAGRQQHSRGSTFMRGKTAIILVCSLVAAIPFTTGAAEMPGVSSTEITIGQTMPYTGPVSAFAALGRGDKKANDEGGINGRRLNLVSLDDG